MQVQIREQSGDLIWSRGEKSGVTSISHRRDGTIDLIIAALKRALDQAEEERLIQDDEVDVARQNTEAMESLLDC